jgi:hypothetical protein
VAVEIVAKSNFSLDFPAHAANGVARCCCRINVTLERNDAPAKADLRVTSPFVGAPVARRSCSENEERSATSLRRVGKAEWSN